MMFDQVKQALQAAKSSLGCHKTIHYTEHSDKSVELRIVEALTALESLEAEHNRLKANNAKLRSACKGAIMHISAEASEEASEGRKGPATKCWIELRAALSPVAS